MTRVTLLAATALVGGMIAPSAARAQTAVGEQGPPTASTSSTGDEEGLREVVVTGSRIVQPAYDGVIPGAQVSGEQIQRRTFTNMLDALTDVPFIGSGASPYGTNGGQPASLGQAYVDLFDLGSARTLTLVNGRRYVSGNAASLFVANNSPGSQVDLSTIPAALIARTDAVTVGGAVAYGSDAIAGVVNIVLKDDVQGLSLGALSGLTARGDGARYRLSALGGTSFAGGRGNVTVALEHDRDDALYGDARAGYRANWVAPTSFHDGGVRNPAYVPTLDGSGGGAFLPAASDKVPRNIAGAGYRGGSLLVSNAGAVFSFDAPGGLADALPRDFQGLITTDPNDLDASPGYRPETLWTMPRNTNLVPGRPVSRGSGCRVTDLTGFCAFAPAALPGTRANATGAAARDAFDAAVIARYASALSGAGGTATQRDALALNLLQAHLPTPRDYLKAHPGTDINAFIGSFVRGFLTVPNRDAASRGALPRVAVPLHFDATGRLRAIVPAVIADPDVSPGTTGGAVGGEAADLDDGARRNLLRAQQDRAIADVLAHLSISDALTLYTENHYARVRSVVPRVGGWGNAISYASAEYSALAIQLSNPYLSQRARELLGQAGVTDRFLLSRTNQDLYDGHPTVATSDTYRTVIGARGEFAAFGKTTHYDASLSYAANDLSHRAYQIRDIEYALAADAVRDAAGNIVCRAQTPGGAGVLGTTPYGVTGQEIVRDRDRAGHLTEHYLRRTVSAAQIAACRPLNLFGYGQMSAEARDYVMTPTRLTNRSRLLFGQASLSGALIDLPGGTARYALFGEYRREQIDYRNDELSRTGGTRSVALADTQGHIESAEFGGEAIVPLLGEDFSAPLLRELHFQPGIRFVRQSGAAPDVRLLDGSEITQREQGRWNRIWSLAGTWRPIHALQVRGNVTRSIRQPSITELFLGGQSAFTAPTDPCASSEIGQGLRPQTRLANCRRAVVDAGLASDTAGADQFLNAYVPSGAAITGVVDGAPGLRPERGRSWTAGVVLTPAFVPRLKLSGDYVHVLVDDQISLVDSDTELQLCYDSPTYPDTTRSLGVNTCRFYKRLPSSHQRAFELGDGFTDSFVNLGKLKVEAANAALDYSLPLGAAAKLTLYANVYHLFHYLSAPDNNLAAAEEAAGSIGDSTWRAQLRPGFERGGFFAQWVWNWNNATRYFSAGAPVGGTDAANEVRDFIRLPGYSLHDATIGYSFGEQRRFGLTFNVSNVFDKLTLGSVPQSYAFRSGIIDDFGRRFTLSVDVRW
ncbi:TonB-dependent receptor [Sphingomonas yunnanensis]|uniref:TonB-dependent receptor n=1 Tax=Sphingomonas yunnanensis TaxID=310400 RepID=UPI001CA6E6CE|nr:TonB-dependent receptor [Sphingomonas yunnanensis]MBY9062713.1 TonB-dependent receptor [Sphingomonas yunnanensis]